MKARTNRYKIWQLPTETVVLLLGNCLDSDEVTTLSHQCQLKLDSPSSSYAAIRALSDAATKNDPPARLINKLLDRKYADPIRRTDCLQSTDQLDRFWNQQLKSDKGIDFFWAIVSHPRIHETAQISITQDLQALSFMRGKQRQISATEQQVAKLQKTVTELRSGSYEKVMRLEAQIQQLQTQIGKHLYTQPKVQLKDAEGKLIEQNKHLQSRLEKTEQQARKERNRCQTLTKRAEGLMQQIILLERENSALQLEQQLYLSSQGNKLNADLQGKRVLYVGDEGSLLKSLRHVVEHSNGRLISVHQDVAETDMKASLSEADIVFCPQDCIHAASCKRAERYCQKNAKPFIPLDRHASQALSLN